MTRRLRPIGRIPRKTVIAALISIATQVQFPTITHAADVLDTPPQIQPRNLSALMTAVTSAGSRLISVGERGVVLLSDDSGQSWRQAKTPVSVTLTNVRFSSPKLGWAVGHSGVVLRSVDGGETWARILTGGEAARIELETARASGQPTRLSEAQRLADDGPDKPFLDVSFEDESRGMIVGAYGLAFRTDDGGRTWTSMMGAFDNPKGKHLYSITKVGPYVYVAAEQGSVFRSKDNGASFDLLQTPGRGTLFGVVAAPDGIVAYGLQGNAYRSADRGDSWVKIDVPATSLTSGTPLSDGSIILTDEVGHLLRSRDSGRNFTLTGARIPMPLSGIVQSASGRIILAGARGNMALPANEVTSESVK